VAANRPFVRRHQLLVFFVLAFAFSWALWPFDPHSLNPLGPFIAALIVLPVAEGKPALLDFIKRIVRFRANWRWYLIAIGLPVLIDALAAVFTWLLGASFAFDQIPSRSELPGTVLFIVLAIGLGEEPAWRGFALPRLAVGRSLLSASLLFGLIHILWHAPLYGSEYDLQNIFPWAVAVVAASVFTAWMYLRTDGNLLLPVLFHSTVDLAPKYSFSLLGPAGQVTMYWLLGVMWVVVALVVIRVAGEEFRRRDVPLPGQPTQRPQP
jgi:membrane protease YdiL (CAAX protease family)